MNTVADGATSFYSLSASEQTLKDIGADKSGSDGTGTTTKGSSGSKTSSSNSTDDSSTTSNEDDEEYDYSSDEYSDEY
jgi:hypothetical protein